MKETVIFDIDNTILQGLSQGLFVDYLYKKGEVSIFYKLSIVLWIILYRLGLVKNPKPVMEHALKFIKGRSVADMDKMIGEFFDSILIEKIYPEAIKIIKEHQLSSRNIILVSNAPDILVKKIANYLDIKNYICTKLELADGIYTGKIFGEIMYGKQKINSVNSYTESEGLSLEHSWGYGDHVSDAHLLSEVAHPYAVNPSKGLKNIAIKKNWPILNFKL